MIITSFTNNELPQVSAADNDKVLTVVNGEWTVANSQGLTAVIEVTVPCPNLLVEAYLGDSVYKQKLSESDNKARFKVGDIGTWTVRIVGTNTTSTVNVTGLGNFATSLSCNSYISIAANVITNASYSVSNGSNSWICNTIGGNTYLIGAINSTTYTISNANLLYDSILTTASSDTTNYMGLISKQSIYTGGVIFYDAGDNGATYTVWDKAGVSKSTGIGGIYYIVNGTPTVDRWYIYETTTKFTSKMWGKSWTLMGFSDGSIGMGKIYTETALTTYSDWETDSMFTYVSTCRNGLLQGYNDWFIGTTNELSALRTSGLENIANVWAVNEYSGHSLYPTIRYACYASDNGAYYQPGEKSQEYHSVILFRKCK